MRSIKMLTLAAAATGALLFTASTAMATAVTTHDDSLTNGWYDGDGTSPNDGFNVVTDTDLGIQTGFRAKLRQDPDPIHTSTNTYTVPLGFEPSPPDSSPNHHVAWNLEWAIDLSSGTLTLGDIYANSTITLKNNVSGATVTEPLTHWVDYATNGPNGKVNETTLSPTQLQHQNSAQQSENPIFADFFPGLGFDAGEATTYTATLRIVKNDGTLLAVNSIDIHAVPEASSVSMVGASLVSLLALGFLPGLRRKKVA